MSMGILQAKILEWLAISFSRASSQAKDQTQVSHIAGIFFNDWATREDLTKDERKEGKQEKVIYIIEIQLIVYVSSSLYCFLRTIYATLISIREHMIKCLVNTSKYIHFAHFAHKLSFIGYLTKCNLFIDKV